MYKCQLVEAIPNIITQRSKLFRCAGLLSLIMCFIAVLPNGCIADGKPEAKTTTAGTFYVAPNGNDQWPGTLSAPNPAKNDGPFATLQHARDVIRRLKSNGSKDQFTVLVRGGIYQLNESFVLGPEDSGTESHPVIFEAYNNEHPILSGARTITNFKQYKGRIVKADLKDTSFDSYTFRQLFAGGKRQILARFPNFDPLDPRGRGFLYVEDQVTEGSKSKFKYQNGSIRDWTNLQDGEVFIYPSPNYWNNIIPIANIDKDHRIITLAKDASYAIKPGNRYFFQNQLEELDSPGEWYFDRREKALYFWPPNDAALEDVTVPVLKSIMEIRSNKKGAMPAYIKFEGFAIEGCEGTAVTVSSAKNITIAKCVIHNAGGHGIEVNGGTENAVSGNDIYEVGGAGIVISGGDRKKLVPAINRAENNYVHHIGIFSKTSSGIDCRGVGNIVSHNLIHSTPRVGISFDGNDHILEYNHVHHVNQETQDSGAIYTCPRDWTKRGNIVRFNYVHDSGGYGRNSASEAWQSPFYTWGIYLDDWTSGTHVYGNIIANTYYGGICVHGGKDNIIENNIIVEGLKEQVRFQDIPQNHPMLPGMFKTISQMGYTKYPGLSSIKNDEKDWAISGNQFRRNIIYFTRKESILYYLSKTSDVSKMSVDQNIIYHPDFPVRVPYTGASDTRQWEAWQERGLDRDSLIADPLFTDISKYNFHLLPQSPAFKQGFQPLPLDEIGPYLDDYRASWPVRDN